jgi:hypothetical protein
MERFSRAPGGRGDHDFGRRGSSESFDHHQCRHCSVQSVGSYAGLTFHSIEGTLHGEVSAEEPVVGLRELAAGRTTGPYQVSFQIVAPESASDADTVVVEAPNRGRTIFPGAISVPAPVTGRPPIRSRAPSAMVFS